MTARPAIYSLRSPRRLAPTGRGPHPYMDALTNPDNAGSDVVTTVFLSNLHCSSCVHSIQNALAALSPAPASVGVSIVTQTVTVRHPASLTRAAIDDAIEEAGFDIVCEAADRDSPHAPSTPLASLSLSHNIARLGTPFALKKQRHLAQCTACQAEERASLERDAQSSINLNEEKLNFAHEGEIHLPSQQKAAEFPPTPNKPERSTAASAVSDDHPQQQVTLSIGGMTCASCSNTVTHALSELPGVSDVVVNLLGNSATLTVERADLVPIVTETVEDVGYEAEIISVEPLRPPTTLKATDVFEAQSPRRVTLSVGGMTCAACSNTVTDVLKGVPGVSDPIVNLLGASATMVVENKDIIPQIVESIEDAGYEAEVVNTEPIKPEKGDAHEIGPRTVAIRVEGLFCSHCPGKVMDAVSSLGDKVTVLKPIIDHTDPILRISYVPSPPTFTLRHIIHRISSADSPNGTPFTATIHQPPSLEDRARRMQQREQRHILERLVFSVLAAIPTFIIGIVYMDLLPSTHPGRMWVMEPFWTGNTSRASWALFFCATPVMFYSAGMFHRRSLKEIWALWKPGSRTPVWKRFVRFGSMNLLVSTGVSVAYFASIALLALAAAQPASTNGEGDTTTYFDSVVFLTMFLLIGRFLEAFSKGRTADAITALGKLRPTSALVVVPASEAKVQYTHSPSGSTLGDTDLEKGDSSREEAELSIAPGTKVEKIDAELLEVGDIVRVQHGGSPPADGTIVSGDGGAFDESSLTGESRLVKKQVGDDVFLGTINKGSVVDVRVNAIGGETMLDHVVKVVREGQTRRAPIERVADMITGYFVPVVTLLAVITWVVWLALGLGGALPPSYLDIDVGGWVVWSLEFAISVFVVACPCGIGLAAPTALLVGSGLAAKHGILARGGGEAFQEAAQLDIIVFDKTGTLTEGGDPKVTDAEIVEQPGGSKLSRAVILGIAAELETASSHPLATAIRQYCLENGASSQTGASFDETPGRGLKAEFGSTGCAAIIGNEAWMTENGCAIDGRLANKLDAWKSEGKSVVLLAIRDESATAPTFSLVGLFAIADPLRPEAESVIRRLHDQGIGTWMISGDNETTAKTVANMVGIPETNVIAGVLPHEKADRIRWLQQVGMKRPQPSLRRLFGKQKINERCVVAMVGDGINDAPALTAADVGIAIGSGSDVAISSAAFILVSANLYTLLTLTHLSRKVFNRVKFNFFWALFYNMVAVPIAAGVIYPAGNARLPPAWASLLMALSSVSVVCSSLALKLYKAPAIAQAK